jgi:hypothetical protein
MTRRAGRLRQGDIGRDRQLFAKLRIRAETSDNLAAIIFKLTGQRPHHEEGDFIARSARDEASFRISAQWIASRSLSSSAHSRDGGSR